MTTEQKIPPELWLDEPVRSKIAERVWNTAVERCAEIARDYYLGDISLDCVAAEIRKLAIAPQEAEK